MFCSKCGKEFNGNFCEYCGAPAQNFVQPNNAAVRSPEHPKKKKPIYKKWWFYVIIAIALIAIIGKFSSGEKSERIDWSDIILGSQLPEPPKDKGEIHKNSSEELWIDIDKISEKQYNDYIEACKEKGFALDAESDSTSYGAYNAEGYKLSLSHYGSEDEMKIELAKPIKMSAVTWPASKAGKQLPVPKSAIGKFSHEYDDNFLVYIGNTSREDYNNYVKACSDKGFTVNYNKGDNYYYADNGAGWHVSIKYEGNNIMSIDIDAPDEDSTAPSASKDTTKQAEPKPTESKSEKSSTKKTKAHSAQGVSKYETIYNEYAQKIRDAAPTSSISELAEIANEGVGKMAEYMWTAKGTDGQYATYEEWSGKLMDVYMSEAR